jgi:hypothetical protein
VLEIKKRFQLTLDRERQNEMNRAQAKRYQAWIAVAGIAGFLNLLAAIGLFISVRAKKRHCAMLRENVAEFTMRKP